MADLRMNSSRMRELIEHLREREGAFNHFYCDSRGLVTIAIGYLVDKSGGSQQTGKGLAKKLGQRADVSFTKPNGSRATPAEVEADWVSVKHYGLRNQGLQARAYTKVANLRIDRPSINAITATVVSRFLDQLYSKRSFMLSYDARVAMALVDVRYNPAGVVLYGSQVQPFWNALNPTHKDFNLDKAMMFFERTWTGARIATKQPSYIVRHYQRVSWMREGLLAGGGRSMVATVI